MKILIASHIDPGAESALRSEHDVVTAIDADATALQGLVTDREAIIFRSGVTLDAAVLSRAERLRLLIRAGCGLDNVDLDYVRRRRLEIVRIAGPGARAVAELCFTFMLVLSRDILTADRATRDGRWIKHEIQGRLLERKTLGIYGVGSIGTTVGDMAVAWGMRTIGCVEHPTSARRDALRKRGIELVGAAEVLERSDLVTLHVPLTPKTRGLFDAAALARMRRGAMLINLARGGVVDEHALHAALLNGHIAGAALDVHQQEGDACISPLSALPNVVLTPHIGASVFDAQQQIGREIVDAVDARARISA